MGLMDKMSPNVECVVCGNRAGLNSWNTKHGRICNDCFKKIKAQPGFGIDTLHLVGEYSIHELKVMCGIESALEEETMNSVNERADNSYVQECATKVGMSPTEYVSFVDEIIGSCNYNKIDAMAKLQTMTGLSLVDAKKAMDILYVEDANANDEVQVVEKSVTTSPISASNSFSTSVKKMTGNICPNCGSADYDVEDTRKTKYRTSVNLNPLHPFTLVNTKEEKKKHLSAGKVALGVMTGGTSLLVTGAHDNKYLECRCRNCGLQLSQLVRL